MNQFHFLHPSFLLLLLPLSYIIYGLYQRRHIVSAWQSQCDPHLLSLLLVCRASNASHIPLLLLASAWILSILALAGPTWKMDKIPLYQHDDATVVLMDMSQNMLAQDITPNRYLRARFKLIDFLKHRKEGQTALIAFTKEPYLVTPLTQDTNNIIALLPELTPDIMPMGGNNIARALNMGAQILKEGNYSKGSLILISAADTVDSSALAAAKSIQEQGHSLHILGIGKTDSAPILAENGSYVHNKSGDIVVTRLNREKLKELAQIGGGSYLDFQNNSSDVEAIFNAFPTSSKSKTSEQDLEIWQNSGYWLVILLLPLALFAFRRGWIDEIEG